MVSLASAVVQFGYFKLNKTIKLWVWVWVWVRNVECGLRNVECGLRVT